MQKTNIIAGVLLLLGFVFLLYTNFTSSATKEKAINAELVDGHGNAVPFSSFKGNVVFVNNWATWCPPCVAEMPSLQKLKKDLADENIQFVMVSYDEDEARAKDFMKKRGYDFDIYFPGRQYPFSTNSIPTSLILNKQGRVVLQHEGMADYSQPVFADRIKSLIRE